MNTRSRSKAQVLLALAALMSLAACGGAETANGAVLATGQGDDSQKRRPPPPPPPVPPSPPVDSSVVGALALASTNAAGQAIGGLPCAISADGNLVAFTSGSNLVVPDDTNGVEDVFVKNLRTAAVQRVSTSAQGAQWTQSSSCRQMTSDGRLVLISTSNPATLVLKNTQTGVATSLYPAASSIPNNTGFAGGWMSDDGNVIAFVTVPTQVYLGAYSWRNTVPARIMVRNLATGSLTTLSTDDGNTLNGEVILGHLNARVSPDGRRLAFVSNSDDLVGGDFNNQADVFVRDLATGETTLASSVDGTSPVLYVSGFQSYYNVEWVNNRSLQFSVGQLGSLGPVGEYLKDVDSGTLDFLLAPHEGSSVLVSADETKLVFARTYSGFDSRIYSRDRSTGVEQLVSSSSNGVASNGNSSNVPAISRDGARVVFNSNASNLFSPAPPAGSYQVYVKTIDAP